MPELSFKWLKGMWKSFGHGPAETTSGIARQLSEMEHLIANLGRNIARNRMENETPNATNGIGPTDGTGPAVQWQTINDPTPYRPMQYQMDAMRYQVHGLESQYRDPTTAPSFYHLESQIRFANIKIDNILKAFNKVIDILEHPNGDMRDTCLDELKELIKGLKL